MKKNTNSTAAIANILSHDDYIGTVLDCAEDMKSLSSSTIERTDNRISAGIESKHDYRMMYSAQRDEELWNATAQIYGLGSLAFTKDKTDIRKEDGSKPKAVIKREFIKFHKSYAPGLAKVDEKAVKNMVSKLNFEDLNGYQFKYNPYDKVETHQLIEVTGAEFRYPYIIISAKSAEDEHDRKYLTRQLDEVSDFFFTFDTRKIKNEKGKWVDHPQLVALRRWMWDKVDHSDKSLTFMDVIPQLYGKVITISSSEFIAKKDENGEIIKDENGKVVYFPNPDFIGYPTYNVEERLGSELDKNSKAYAGSYTNICISNKDIEEMNGDISFKKTSDAIQVYSGKKLLRSYKIHEA